MFLGLSRSQFSNASNIGVALWNILRSLLTCNVMLVSELLAWWLRQCCFSYFREHIHCLWSLMSHQTFWNMPLFSKEWTHQQVIERTLADSVCCWDSTSCCFTRALIFHLLWIIMNEFNLKKKDQHLFGHQSTENGSVLNVCELIPLSNAAMNMLDFRFSALVWRDLLKHQFCKHVFV